MKIPMYTRGMKTFVWGGMLLTPLICIGLSLYILLNHTTPIEIVLAALLIIFSVVFSPFAIYKIVKDGQMNSMIEITDEGIALISKKKRCKMRWENIKMVGLSQPTRNSIILSTYPNLSLLNTVIRYEHLSDNLIVVQKRTGLVEEIKQHWHGTIID